MESKPSLSVVFLGHVESGKSTTMGHYLHLVLPISERYIEKLKQFGREIGRESYCYAFICDRTRVERERGITIKGGAHREIIGFNFNFWLIDAPGHRDYLKNLITCTSQADVAVLVVSADIGGFEIGMSSEGKTQEHCRLAHIFGIKRLVVIVNKMDSVQYGKARFEEIKAEIQKMLEKGKWASEVSIIPVSSWIGDNLIVRSANMPWYEGPTLQEALEALPPVPRDLEKPFRMLIDDIYRIRGTGRVVTGTVVSGRIIKHSNLAFGPTNLNFDVASIECFHAVKESAEAGDSIGIALPLNAINTTEIRRGHVAGTSYDPPMEVERFVGRIILFKIPYQMKNGYRPVIDIGTAHVACNMRLLQMLEKYTGEVHCNEPRSIKSGDAAMVEFTPLKPLCVETFAHIPALGRFTIRDNKKLLGAGVVMSVDRKVVGGKLTKSAVRGGVR